MKGKFIVLDGMEGSGKSSAIRKLYKNLENEGIQCVLTREPGGSPLSERLRDIFKSSEYPNIHPYTELLLVSASRLEHAKELIIPSLESGKWVLCDRYYLSSLIYQGMVGLESMLPVKEILDRMAQFNALPEPDLTLILDVAPEVGLSRARQTNPDEVRMEDKGISFHKKVRQGFLNWKDITTAAKVILTEDKTIEEINNEIFMEVKDQFL